MSSRFEDKARELHSNGINCSNSLYFAFKDIFYLGDNVPQPRSIDGLCGTVLTTEYILKRLGKVEYIKEYREQFVDKFGYLKCVDLLKHGRKCNDYVGFSANYISEKIFK